MADYNQPTFVEKRVRYYETQDLEVQDRIDEQKYHLDRLRRYSRALSVAGIVDGLAVKPGPNQVTVAPGTAIDKWGRQLVLGYEEPVKDLSAYKGKTVELVIAYRERPSDLKDGEGTKFWERPWVGPLDTVPTDPAQALDPADALHLARLSVANDGAVTVDTSRRESSGLRLAGGTLGDPTTWHMLRVRDGALHLTGNPPGAAKLLVDGALQVTGPSTLAGDVILPGTAKLTVGGALSVTGASTLAGDVTLPGAAKLTVGGALTVTGTSTLTGDLTLPRAAKLTVGGELFFGSATRQMINLWGEYYGIGIQDNTHYARTSKHFAWYKGGRHDDGELKPGTGGAVQMVITEDGKVGIGIGATPQETLHVAGPVLAHGFRTTDGVSLEAVRDSVKMLVPIGTIMAYGGDTTSAAVVEQLRKQGWLPCDGRPASGQEYGELFTAIGTAFGTDAQGAFRVPDLRGRFLRGTDQGQTRDPDAERRRAEPPGANAGDRVGSVQDDILAAHTHPIVGPLAPIGSSNVASNLSGTINDISQFHETAKNPDGGSETRPKNINVNWIIKAKHLPAA